MITQVTYSVSDEEIRILPVKEGSVECLPGKKQLTSHCSLCIHCREFRVGGKFLKSPSLAYCSRCHVTDKVDVSKADAVKCADRQGEGFHSIANIVG